MSSNETRPELPADDYAVRYLVAVAERARCLLGEIEARRQAGLSDLDYAGGHGQLASMLGSLVDAVASAHGEASR
ncbi:hypothetical protein [Yinghuangia seranimata]|uniref:hypothetical protein n=1 Tax=Yinghuangia seranimata TaxID=408067 RepID=UPI00248AA641|nr:hypothetical protein [Yinghuangia seranimata]MDI2127959.1 hypothetical protein [Yinghuangia seranimata]